MRPTPRGSTDVSERVLRFTDEVFHIHEIRFDASATQIGP